MSLAPKLLAPPLVLLTLLVGLWFWGSVVAPGYWSTIGLCVAWFVACSMIFGRVTNAQPELLWWVRGTFLAASVFAVGAFYWTSIRDKEVNEQIVTGAPASEVAPAPGAVDPLAPQTADSDVTPKAKPANLVEHQGPVKPASHSASGTARIVKLAQGGRRLTLSDGFEIDPGPQVKVYLATDTSGATYKDLGELKGNKGNQQYTVPRGVDLDEYDTVVFWCVPFTVTLAAAELDPA